MDYKYEKENSRVAVYDDGKEIGECTYSESKGLWIIDHTYVDPTYRGQHIAENLVKEVVDKAREEGVKIIPLCPYAKKEFDRKEEYQDMLQK